MFRFSFWAVVGLGIGALGLWYGDSLWMRLVVKLRLPGWLTLLGVFAMLALLASVYLNSRWSKLAEGDLRNFLQKIVDTCMGVAGAFSGIGIFAGTHWVIQQTGYGHGVFMLSAIISGSFAWIGYGLRDLYDHLVKEHD